MIHLVTFSDESMSRSAELCVESAKRHGVEAHADIYTRAGIEYSSSDGSQNVIALMDSNPRGGGGCFVWKPFVILDAMTMCDDGNYLIYSDAGIEFINNVNYIIDRMDQDIFLFGNMYEHAHWCKRDVVDDVWPALARASQDAWFRFDKQVQASVIFFRVSDYTRQFVKEWLDWCLFEGGRLIDDSPSRTPNHPEFRENRHDQSILTTLAYREGLYLHWWPAVYNRFVPGGPVFTYDKGEYVDTYPPLFHHHRLRDGQWPQHMLPDPAEAKRTIACHDTA